VSPVTKQTRLQIAQVGLFQPAAADLGRQPVAGRCPALQRDNCCWWVFFSSVRPIGMLTGCRSNYLDSAGGLACVRCQIAVSVRSAGGCPTATGDKTNLPTSSMPAQGWLAS